MWIIIHGDRYMKIYITLGQAHIHKINNKILNHNCLIAI